MKRFSIRDKQSERVRLIDIPVEEAEKISPIAYEINKYCPYCKGRGVWAGKVCKCVTVEYPPEPEITGV